MNPFGKGSISAECADYMSVDALNKIDVKQKIAEATITGPLFALPAGDLSAAFGVFYKKDEFSFIADEKLRAETTGAFGLPVRADVSGFNATDNTTGETDSTEFYVETLIPLLADRPGIQRLDATLGYRFADYSTAGGVNSYKAELTYAPSDPFLIRGSYQRAVRAPNITELFQPQVTNFPSFNPPDPCNATSAQRTGPNGAAVRDLCLAQGLPAALINNFNYANQQVEGLQGGNPDLGEETADSLTLGVVWNSNLDGIFSDFRASVDWYSIEIQDAISFVAAETFMDRCYDPQFNPNFEVDNFYCSFFTRNTFNGEVTDAAETKQNLGAINTSGVDIQFDWALDAGPGRLSMNWVGSWLDKWEQQELPGDVFTQYGGTIGTSIATAFPDWKWTFNLNYNIAGVGLNARWRYVDGMSDESEPQFQVGSYSYFDVAASYGFGDGMLKGLGLRAGVTNLFDKDPAIYPSYVQSNTDPSTYDVLGRRYFMAVTYSFQ
jgi:outer membrane receptor protein involved in Fe transport